MDIRKKTQPTLITSKTKKFDVMIKEAAVPLGKLNLSRPRLSPIISCRTNCRVPHKESALDESDLSDEHDIRLSATEVRLH